MGSVEKDKAATQYRTAGIIFALIFLCVAIGYLINGTRSVGTWSQHSETVTHRTISSETWSEHSENVSFGKYVEILGTGLSRVLDLYRRDHSGRFPGSLGDIPRHFGWDENDWWSSYLPEGRSLEDEYSYFPSGIEIELPLDEVAVRRQIHSRLDPNRKVLLGRLRLLVRSPYVKGGEVGHFTLFYRQPDKSFPIWLPLRILKKSNIPLKGVRSLPESSIPKGPPVLHLSVLKSVIVSCEPLGFEVTVENWSGWGDPDIEVHYGKYAAALSELRFYQPEGGRLTKAADPPPGKYKYMGDLWVVGGPRRIITGSVGEYEFFVKEIGTNISSERFKITVEAPPGEYEEARKLFSSPKGIKEFLGRLESHKAQTPFERILAEFPDSPYAPYVAVPVWRRRYDDVMRQYSGDPYVKREKVKELAEAIVKQGMKLRLNERMHRSWHHAKFLYDMTRFSFKAGRRDEAIKYAREAVAKYKGTNVRYVKSLEFEISRLEKD